MDKPRIATLWLDGCSGCHMSLLDMDERLLEIAGKIELVYSPVADAKEFPDNVDLTLVEAPSPAMKTSRRSSGSQANPKCWLRSAIAL